MSDLNLGEETASGHEHNDGREQQYRCVEDQAEVGHADQRGAQAVDAVSQRVEAGDHAKSHRQVLEGIERAGEEEDWHYQEVHDQLKSLYVLQHGTDARAETGEDGRDQGHKQERDRDRRETYGPEAGDQTDD